MASIRRRTTEKAPPDVDTYRSKKRDDDDDDLEARRRARRAAADDDPDDDDEDAEPRRRRARDEDEDRPVRRAGARRDDDRDDDDDADDDDEPRAGKRGRNSAGWSAWDKRRKASSAFGHDLKVPDDGEQILVKFLDNEPFASYGQHWIQGPQGKRSWVCLDEGCPLCDKLGDTPRALAAFNVLVLTEGEDPEHKVWAAGPAVTQQLHARSEARTGPLTKEYYAVSRTKGGKGEGPVKYMIDVVRTRDLEDEWGVEPLSESELRAWERKRLDEGGYVKRPNKQELRALVREVFDDAD